MPSMFEFYGEKVKPETLSSSLMKTTFPLAVILIRPDQSGVSNFQSAALFKKKICEAETTLTHCQKSQKQNGH